MAARQAAARARVLQAAMDVIADVGPDRVRVQDVADRAGMSPGHVMYYFGRRDRILVDTLLLGEADLASRRDRRVAAAADPWDAVERLVRLYLPQGPDDVRWKLWAQLLARPPRDAETRAAFAALVDSWAVTLARIVADGLVTGAFAPPPPAGGAALDPERLGHRTCRLMDGYAVEVLMGAAGRTRAWAVADVLSVLRDALRPPVGPLPAEETP